MDPWYKKDMLDIRLIITFLLTENSNPLLCALLNARPAVKKQLMVAGTVPASQDHAYFF